MNNPSKDLIAASSIPIVLSILSQGESYGYDIISKIKAASNGKLEFSDGTLYPILRKLEEKKLIVSEWRVADNEKRRRYYRITDTGKEKFDTEKLNWKFMNELLQQFWNQPQPKLI
ncbi:MAG: PadR family transcriptional regulator [Bacteroidota bacterium]